MGGQDRPHRDLEGARRRARGWCGGSTSTATTRPTATPTAASTARSTSTSWSPTATGSMSSAATTSRYGQFGENFTVEGLADDEVCIGDRYRIGERDLRGHPAAGDVLSPGDPDGRAADALAAGRPPSPGLLPAGAGGGPRAGRRRDRPAGGAGPSGSASRTSTALLYLPHRSRRTLERALRIPALSEGWKGSFRTLLEQRRDATEPPPPAWEGFQPLTVTEIRRESATIASFTLAPADGAPPPPGTVSPGQYLTLRLRPGGPDRPAVIRSYSLSTVAGHGGYRISVKREPHGVGSAFLHEHMRVGDTIEAAAPRGAFTLRDGDAAGRAAQRRRRRHPGAGDAPRPSPTRGDDPRGVVGPRRPRRPRARLRRRGRSDCSPRCPTPTGSSATAGPAPARRRASPLTQVGRVSIETITAAGVPVDADYYLCGPDGFMRSLSAALVARGTTPEHVAMEVFGAQAVIAAAGSRAASTRPRTRRRAVRDAGRR